MKIAVIGAGAIGCYFGGLLARAGHQVTFVGRAVHVDAINASGLLLETAEYREHLPACAALALSPSDRPDLVLLCVKSADTESAGRALASSLSPQTTILSLQNGVDNAERLEAVLARPVIPAVVYVGTEMAGAGHVRLNGPGQVLVGALPGAAEVARLFGDVGMPTTVSNDIARAQWIKLVTNCAYNALSAVAQIPYGPMLEMPGTTDVIADVIRECASVAGALGISLPGDLANNILALAGRMPRQLSSTAQDLARGKPTEIDYLNGYVVRKGAEAGIPTPANRALLVMVKLAERSRTHASRKPS